MLQIRFAPHTVLPLLLLVASTVVADETRRPAIKRSERIARASWQPVRASGANQSTVIRQVQDLETLPVPQGTAEATPANPQPVPLSGPVVMDGGPVVMDGGQYFDDGGFYGNQGFGGDLACDAMVCGGTGCGGCGGVGCDSAGHCDSMGCGGGVGCGHRGGWRPCLTICFPQDGWFAADYLMWSQRGMDLPPLVTRGNALGTQPIIGNPGVDVIYGNNPDHLDGRLDGVRLNFGLWLDRCHEWSISADYFGFEEISESVRFFGNGVSSLGRPIRDVSRAGGPNGAELVEFNDGTIDITGNVGVFSRSQLRSGGFQFRRFLACKDGCGETVFLRLPANFRSRFDLGIGYRYTQLDEGLIIDENLNSRGNTFLLTDNFDTRTQFNGFDFAIYYTRMRGNWSLDLQGRMGIGTNRQNVTIAGGRIENGIPANGGLLAQTTNIGSYARDRFAVLPEFRATLGYQLTPRLRANLGYTFLYWSNVVRPGDQIDLDVDPNLLGPVPPAGATRPAFAFNETDYWAQGISFGGEYRW
ncbi:BBP7 family outer membrane beta-barrel protein [Planctomycetaceae bacterium SH139]